MEIALKILVVFLLLQVIFALGSPFIFGDGYGYYHVGYSLVHEQNFVQKSRPSYLENANHAVSLFKDQYVSVYSVGNSILWLPFLLVASLFSSGDKYGDYFYAFNGHSFEDGFAILVAACFYALLSIYFMNKTSQSLGFSKKITYISLGFIYLSSFALGYVLTNASYSHTYEIFAISGILYSLTQYSKKFNKKWMMLAGLFGGLSVLTRSLNILIALPITIYILIYQSKKAFFIYLLSSMPLALVFFLYNYISYGKVVASGYSEVWGANLSLQEFNLLNLLFSDIRGWFVYSPVVVFALIGLIMYAKRSRQSTLLYIVPVVLTILVYSFWENWWAGDSIAQRFYLNLTPFLTIGIAYMLKKSFSWQSVIQYTFISILTLLTVYSFTLLMLYRVTPVETLGLNKSTYDEIPPAEKYSAFDIFQYHFELIANSTSVSNYMDNLQGSLQGGRSLALLYFGKTKPILTLDTSSNKLMLLSTAYQNDFDFSVFIELRYSDQILNTFALQEVNSKSRIELEYECGAFIKDYCEFRSNDVYISNLYDTQLELNNPQLVFDKDDKVEFIIFTSEDIKLIY